MTRQEENKKIRDYVREASIQKPNGTYEEIVSLQLGTISILLADISKSLAIIADKTESEV